MNHLDCCSGVGGFALGLERAGFTTVGFCEIDPYARAVLQKHWPEVYCHDDLRSLSGHVDRFPRIDIITGGIPCQPASLAGNRGGSGDGRWLWPEFFEVVSAFGPRWVVAENVLGITSLKPHGLDWICRSFRDIGYEPWPLILSAHNVGAPHLRRRVWIIAHAADPLADADRRGREQQRVTQHTGVESALRRESDRCDSAGWGNGTAAICDADGIDREGRPAAALEGQAGFEVGILHADSERCEKQQRPESAGEKLGSAERTNRRVAESRVGVLVDGISNGLDRGWWIQEPQGVPRVATEVPHRVDQLRALGNAVVPQIVTLIGRAIMDLEACRE